MTTLSDIRRPPVQQDASSLKDEPLDKSVSFLASLNCPTTLSE